MTAIFPAFNEEVSIGSIVLRTHQHAHRVIVVDDGATDCTAQVDEMAGGEIKIKPQMNTDEHRCGYNNIINTYQPDPGNPNPQCQPRITGWMHLSTTSHEHKFIRL